VAADPDTYRLAYDAIQALAASWTDDRLERAIDTAMDLVPRDARNSAYLDGFLDGLTDLLAERQGEGVTNSRAQERL
jgi:hypothetical protein